MRNKMKKYIILAQFLALSVGAASVAIAQVGPIDTAPVEAPDVNVVDALNSIINWLFAFLLIIAALFLIVAGFYFVTAQGDADKVKTARQFVLYALIGVLIGFLAKGLVILVGFIVGQEISPNQN